MSVVHAADAKLDLGMLVADAISEIVDSGVIQNQIRASIEKTVKESIANQLTSYSDFGKRLAAAVGRSLQIHGDIDLPSYNDTVLKFVRDQLESETRNTIQRQIAERMRDLLQPVPATISIEKLVDQYREHLKHEMDSGCVCDGPGEFLFRIDRDKASYMTHYRDFAFSGSSEDKSPDIVVGVRIETADPDRGQIWHLRFRDGDVEKKLFVGPVFGFERTLFQMKAANTVITGLATFDADDVDTSLNFHD